MDRKACPPTYRALRHRLDSLAKSFEVFAARYAHDESVADALRQRAVDLVELSQSISSTKRDPLSIGQQRVMAYLRDFIRKHGMAPTRLEIARGLNFSSPNAAQEHLQVLAHKGVITLSPGEVRGIRINTERPTLTRKAS